MFQKACRDYFNGYPKTFRARYLPRKPSVLFTGPLFYGRYLLTFPIAPRTPPGIPSPFLCLFESLYLTLCSLHRLSFFERTDRLRLSSAWNDLQLTPLFFPIPIVSISFCCPNSNGVSK